jgi:putative flippase GtrA
MLTPTINSKREVGGLSFLASLRRYFAVGAIATAVDWAIFSFLVFVMDWHYLLGGIVSFLVATFAGYLSGLRLVFRGGRHARWAEIAFVYLVSFFGFAMHAGALLVLVGWLQFNVFLAKAAATVVTFLWNFAMRYFWIFERPDTNE